MPGVPLCSFFVNFWEILRARPKKLFLYLVNIECAYGFSVVHWLSLIVRPQAFPQRKIFFPKSA